MNCQEFWNNLPEAVDSVELANMAWANQEHMAQCPACAGRLRSQLALKKGLRALAGQMRRTEAPASVEARLRAEFRAHNGRAHNGSEAAPVRRWRPVLTWAAAVAAIFVMAVLLMKTRIPSTPLSVSHVVSNGSELADTGIDSSFIPLPNAAQIDPAEEVNVVRVEVRRSAMIALGYDIKPEEASQSVQADVMLGTDGLARAVRFLD